MKFAITSAAALMLGAAPVFAGGIERTDQGFDALFETGNYAELSFGHVRPKVDGVDATQYGPGGVVVYPGGVATGNVSGKYNTVGFAYKRDFTDQLSGALILEQPFGADLYYPNPATDGEGTPLLGGTSASVDSTHLLALVRYKMPNNFGVHGGLRIARADGSVTLSGLAYTNPVTGASVSGYNVDLDTDTSVGWVAGVSWEKPEIAARVALTFQSQIKHEFDSTETLTPTLAALIGAPAGVPIETGITEVNTPKSWTLDFQTGVAADTLVFGSIRWVDWSSFLVAPPVYGAALGSLTELDDSTTYTLGVGRKFNDSWSGAASVSFEKSGDNLVSPLAPTNGRKGITLAAIYTRDQMKITTGINYTKLGDADPETGTPDTARANMTDNSALGIGVKVGFSF